MYEVRLINNGVETTIHYPAADQDIPHLNKLPLKEGLSLVDSLSFVLYPNNLGYDQVFELTTKIKVIDTRDNTTRFTGRVLDIDEKMDSGLFYKEVLCEGSLSYLNDSKQRANSFITANPTDFLTQILAIHNAKVDITKQIQVGNVDVIGGVAYTCNFETTLACILAVKEKLGGDIRVRESNGILYLDWLQSFSVNTVEVRLGVNMKGMVKAKDVTSLGTRIIPLGANNLTIASVNGGLDYIEDTVAKGNYGVIEKPVEYKDITDATELYNTCLADLTRYTQPLYLLESNALDLSFLTGNKAEQFALGTNLHIINPVMAIDSFYKIVAIDLDLLQPYNPSLTIANFPIKLSTAINDLRKTSVQNNGVYNNVQIGDAFGLRVVRSDQKVIATFNATDCIKIENNNKTVYSLDENGDIVANDGTYNNITAEGGTFNDITANRGVFDDITANRGTYKDITATEMRTSETDDYIKLHELWMDFYENASVKMQIGIIDLFGMFIPAIYAPDSLTVGSNGTTKIEGNIINLAGNAQVSGNTIATQSWVEDYVAAHAYVPPETP